MTIFGSFSYLWEKASLLKYGKNVRYKQFRPKRYRHGILRLHIMAQSQIICDASAMGKTRVIRTKSFAPVVGALRTPAACRKYFRHRHTRCGPKLKIIRLLARFFTHFGHPRHNLR